MHQKRMAQVDGAGLSGRKDFPPRCRFCEAVRCEFSQRSAAFARGREHPRYIEVGTRANTRRGVVLANIGEEKQHQQGAAFRSHVDSPVQEFVGIGGLESEAGINVPARISGIVWRRKPDRKRPQVGARQPAPSTYQLIEGSMQNGRVGGPDKRFLSIHAKPDDGLGPCCRIRRIAARVAPEDGAALVGKFARKGVVDFHESIADELPDLTIAQDLRGVTTFGRHQ